MVPVESVPVMGGSRPGAELSCGTSEASSRRSTFRFAASSAPPDVHCIARLWCRVMQLYIMPVCLTLLHKSRAPVQPSITGARCETLLKAINRHNLNQNSMYTYVSVVYLWIPSAAQLPADNLWSDRGRPFLHSDWDHRGWQQLPRYLARCREVRPTAAPHNPAPAVDDCSMLPRPGNPKHERR